MSSSPTRPSVERIRRAAQVDEAIVLVSRASHDPRLCKKLWKTWLSVLEAYGIKNLSSFRTDWFRRDDVLLIAVLTPDGEKVLAGARLQPGMVASDFPLRKPWVTWTPRWANFWKRSFLKRLMSSMRFGIPSSSPEWDWVLNF